MFRLVTAPLKWESLVACCAAQKLGSKGAGSKLPEIAGKRAEAHNLSLEIDIDEISANPLPKPRPAVAPSSTALASANGAARPRTTLSVTDYKRRMGIL
eukprot:3084705-Pleurochrysis_carterae.AAC.2